MWARRDAGRLLPCPAVGERATHELRLSGYPRCKAVYDACTQLPASLPQRQKINKIKFQPDQENYMTKVTRAVIVGGGIGGAATACHWPAWGSKWCCWKRRMRSGDWRGHPVGAKCVFGAGQPRVGEVARQRAVFTDHITMMDA